MGNKEVLEDRPIFVVGERARRRRRLCGCLAAGAACLALAAIAGLLALAVCTLARVRRLEAEVEGLRDAIAGLKRPPVDGDQYEDLGSPIGGEVLSKPEDIDDGYYDINYDYAYNDGTADINEEDDDYSNDIVDSGIHRVLTANQLTKDGKNSPRTKRNVIGYTENGVPINSEPFAEALRKNGTKFMHRRVPTVSSIYESERPSRLHHEMGAWDAEPTPPTKQQQDRKTTHPDSRPPQVAKQMKSFLKSGDQHRNSWDSIEFTVIRDDQVGRGRTRHRQRNLEDLDERERHPRLGRMRPLPTVHFSGDTSKYIVGHHPNFNGNGHLRHPQRTFVDWEESTWVRTLGMDQHFQMDDGYLTIKESGLYFVYAQIYYLDEHDTNGFRVHKNDETMLQCTVMIHSLEKVKKGNTCYTAGAEYLVEGDRISLRDLSDARYSIFEPGKSFFGVIKLGDVKIK